MAALVVVVEWRKAVGWWQYCGSGGGGTPLACPGGMRVQPQSITTTTTTTITTTCPPDGNRTFTITWTTCIYIGNTIPNEEGGRKRLKAWSGSTKAGGGALI